MEVTTQTNDDRLIIQFVGKLDTGTAGLAESETNKHIENHKKVVMDLSETTFVSSAGLRVFLATAKRLMAKGGKLRLCNANEVVTEILDMSGFSTILDVKSSLDEALESF